MKNTIKIALSLLLVLVFAAFAFACNKEKDPSSESSKPVAKDLDVDDLAKKIAENCSFEDEYLALVENRDFSLQSRNIDASLVEGEEGAKKAAIYASSSTPEMVVCIKAVDEAAAAKVMEQVQNLIDDYAHNYTTYGPEQVEKLESAVKVTNGQYVVVAVTAENTTATSFIYALMK